MASPLSPEAQAALLRVAFPDADSRVEANELRWRLSLRPTDMSMTYVVSIRYKRGAVSVRVAHPPLQLREGQRPPHLYPDDRLCLYEPGKGQWDGSQAIAATIVPWAMEWLAFYEFWLACGEWLGGGSHPESGATSSPAQQLRQRARARRLSQESPR